MYGQIHCIIRELIEVNFGTDKWTEILTASGMDEDIHFLVFSNFDDDTTLRLLDACCRSLGLSLETVLKEFGTFFLTYFLKHGYDKMLLTMGRDLCTFSQNLDSLHSMLSLSYRGLVSPSFRCLEHEDGTLTVHYYSWREGLYPIVQGLLEAVGKELFNQVATVTLMTVSKEEVDTLKYLHHTVLKVELYSIGLGQSPSNSRLKRLNENKLSRRRLSTIDPGLPPRGGYPTVASVEDLAVALPYHLVMDNELHILQCGDKIRFLMSFPITNSTTFKDIAVIDKPLISPTFDHIISFINSIFFLRLDPNHSHPVPVKGQMIYLPGCGKLMFMGSPRMQSLNEAIEMKMYLDNIPLYDCTRELWLLNQQRLAEIDVAIQLDETTIALKKMSKAFELEKHKTEELLHEMMPAKVARQLQEEGYVNAEKHEWSTVLFTSIVTFTDITISCGADQVVSMLNDMYNRFDTRADTHTVYKVETIGDAYMAVTGVPEAQAKHAQTMADFALDILEDASDVLSPATGIPLQIQVGMHSGSVVSGVIGMKKPRYDIYGDTVNTASRMTSHSVPGRIHVSPTTFQKLYPCCYFFKDRGIIEVKGKGKMNTYFLTGSLELDVEQPDDEFTSLPTVWNAEAGVQVERPRSARKPKLTAPKDVKVLRERLLSMHSGMCPQPWQSSALSSVMNAKRSSHHMPVPTISHAELIDSHHGLSKITSHSSRTKPAGSHTKHSPSTYHSRRSTRMGSLPAHHSETWNLSPPPPTAGTVRTWPAASFNQSANPSAGGSFPYNTNPKNSHTYIEDTFQSECDPEASAIALNTESSAVLMKLQEADK